MRPNTIHRRGGKPNYCPSIDHCGLRDGSPTVGIAGLTLGGGFGLTVRLFGLACDSLESLEMVSAKGDIALLSPAPNHLHTWGSGLVPRFKN